MKLLTKRLIKKFQKLESTDNKKPEEIKMICKFFLPDSYWSWMPFEYDGDDTFFGLVRGVVTELGYFNLSELLNKTGPLGMHVERDILFKEHTLKEVMENTYLQK